MSFNDVINGSAGALKSGPKTQHEDEDFEDPPEENEIKIRVTSNDELGEGWAWDGTKVTIKPDPKLGWNHATAVEQGFRVFERLQVDSDCWIIRVEVVENDFLRELT